MINGLIIGMSLACGVVAAREDATGAALAFAVIGVFAVINWATEGGL